MFLISFFLYLYYVYVHISFSDRERKKKKHSGAGVTLQRRRLLINPELNLFASFKLVPKKRN